MDARTAARALGGEVAGRNTVRCPGPGHSRGDRSLAVRFTGGDFVVHSFAGDDWRACRDHVKAALGITGDRPSPPEVPPAPRVAIDPERLKKSQEAMSVWGRSILLDGTLVETYLHSRGLSYDGDALRFWPGGRAMVALITDAVTAEPTGGIHRTFLDQNGRRLEKKMLGRARGGVVRLSGDDDVTGGLALAEGIETALAAPFTPIWACLSAGTMKDFPVLPGVEALTIFADNDASGTGQNAADECGRRWHAAGREVTVNIVDEVGRDFADIREAA